MHPELKELAPNDPRLKKASGKKVNLLCYDSKSSFVRACLDTEPSRSSKIKRGVADIFNKITYYSQNGVRF